MGCGLFGFGVAGCLADDGRLAPDTSTSDTSTSDSSTSDSSTSDSSTSDSSTSDSDTVSCGDCDDNDPCTYDRCGADGQCEHLQPPTTPASGEGGAVIAPECTGNADCDDNDACTEDLCITFPGGCGVVTATCAHEPAPGCTAKCGGPIDCDDGNPCTIDECLFDGTCVSTPMDGCDPQCTSVGLVPLADLANGTASVGGDVRTAGVIAPWTTYQACNDGPTCDCDGAPAVTDQGYSLGLRAAADAGGVPIVPPLEPWTCQTHGCSNVDLTVDCRPVEEGVVYRVWGHPLASWDTVIPFGAVIARPPSTVGIEVTGYCLDTAGASLSGHYRGDLEVMADTWLTFDVDMTAVDQGVIVTFGRAECSSGNCPDWATMDTQTTVLEEGDGQIGLAFRAPSMSGTIDAHAQLFSHQSQLSGRWGLPTFVPNGVALMIGGQMTLTRDGTGKLPEPIGL
ncbi:MAG: hypothetical protein U1F43_38940 [Myxococcota bacterium]